MGGTLTVYLPGLREPGGATLHGWQLSHCDRNNFSKVRVGRAAFAVDGDSKRRGDEASHQIGEIYLAV